jgi:hypothetical protein
VTVLFNPFTGKPRHPSDIASDPGGVLIWDGETPLMAAAKTPPERKAAERERRKAQGLTRLEVYAHPEDHEPIKALAAKLQRKRERTKAKEPK